MTTDQAMTTRYTATDEARSRYGEGIDQTIASADLPRLQSEIDATFEGVTLSERRTRDGMEIIDQTGAVIYTETVDA